METTPPPQERRLGWSRRRARPVAPDAAPAPEPGIPRAPRRTGRRHTRPDAQRPVADVRRAILLVLQCVTVQLAAAHPA